MPPRVTDPAARATNVPDSGTRLSGGAESTPTTARVITQTFYRTSYTWQTVFTLDNTLPSAPPATTSSGTSSQKLGIILGGTLGGIFFLIAVTCCYYCCLGRRHGSSYSHSSSFPSPSSSPPISQKHARARSRPPSSPPSIPHDAPPPYPSGPPQGDGHASAHPLRTVPADGVTFSIPTDARRPNPRHPIQPVIYPVGRRNSMAQSRSRWRAEPPLRRRDFSGGQGMPLYQLLDTLRKQKEQRQRQSSRPRATSTSNHAR